MSNEKKPVLRETWKIIKDILAVISAIAAVTDLYQSRMILWQAIQTGEPLLVTVVLLQTSWFLFGVFLLCAILVFHHNDRLTKDNLIPSTVALLIASFLLTWGIRASYFGVTGHIYPGQNLLEFRVETIVAAAVLFVCGIILVIIPIWAESEGEIPELVFDRKPVTDPNQIAKLQENLRSILDEKHTPSCNVQERKCQKLRMFHYGLAKSEAKCKCSCHK